MGRKPKYTKETKIKEYIEFYNNKRFQAKLKCLTPMEYRNQALSAYFFYSLSTLETSYHF